MANPIRWGIIGCGSVCEVKSGPGFQNVDGSTLAAVMRRDGDKARDFARRHHVPRWYDDADTLIRDADVDAIYIATPVGTHAALALKVADAGKACYVEKPMARNLAECAQMNRAFAQRRLPLFVAYYRRALPRFVKVKSLIDARRLGTISGVHYRFAGPQHRDVDPDHLPWRLVPEQSGGGLIMDLGSHTLDLLDYLLGPLQDVAGHAANLASPYAVEDTVTMSFRTAAGVPGAASWNFASPVSEDRITITGSDARVSLSTFGNEPVQLESADGCESFDLPNPKHIQQPLIQTIVDELRSGDGGGGGNCPSTGVTAARTNGVLDAVLAGYYDGRDDGFWTRMSPKPTRQV
ncbi:MAG: Gfo/Idh/MocA family oxidoreductase [Phycisphaeraceae bacterium]